MISTSTLTKVKQQPQAKKVVLRAGQTRRIAGAIVRSQVQHDVSADLIGKGKTARAHTTHSFTHNVHTATYTYGAGKGRVNLAYTHKQNGNMISSHSANVNLRKVAAGGALAYGGYKAYQHRDQIRAKAAQVHNGVHNAFHSTHQNL